MTTAKITFRLKAVGGTNFSFTNAAYFLLLLNNRHLWKLKLRQKRAREWRGMKEEKGWRGEKTGGEERRGERKRGKV